ncbi:MAG: MATE family efflux transporter, partial [Chromatiales bacterium]|nr:MATE family efflux transporter [Chromatiales bacterium]
MQTSHNAYSDRAIWSIAAPMMLSGVSVPMLGFVDTAVMGHLGDAYWMGAVAAGATIFTVLFMGMNFLRMGTTGLAAQALGAGKAGLARTILAQSSIIALVLAALLILLQAPLLNISLQLIAAPPDVEIATREYFGIRIWAAPATLINFTLVGWFLGMQNARAPLAVILLINLLNIALDLLLVPVSGWQIAGVAWASVIAEYAGLALAVVLLQWELTKHKGRIDLSELWQVSRYRRLFSINTDLFIRTMALMLILAFITAQGARYGELILAANAVLLNLQLFLSYALDGLAHAAEALSGKAFGSQNRAALRWVVKRSFYWSVLIAAIFCGVYGLLGEAIVGAVTNIPEVQLTAAEYLPWLIVSPLISVWCFLYDG